MEYSQIVATMRRHYNSETRKLHFQSEMDGIELASFMHKNHITDHATGLSKLINRINALAPQLPMNFGDNKNKTRNLRPVVMGFDWAQQPIAQMTTDRYAFSQFVRSLQESLQLKEEMSRAVAIRTDYGQYVNHPHNVARPYNRRSDDDISYSS